MRVLMTGATGYIGSHVAGAFIKQGWDVHALVRMDSRCDRLPLGVRTHVIDGDNLESLVSSAEPDIVVHLAATVTAGSDAAAARQVLADNVAFGVQLLRAVAASPCRRLITTGTCWEYDEAGNYKPNTLYAASKRAFAAILAWFAERYQIDVTTLVLFDVYGANDWRGKMLPALIDKMKSGEPMALSPGEQLVDFVHVDDVAAAYVVAARQPVSRGVKVWGVASGRLLTLRQAVDILCRLAGRASVAQWGALPYPPHQIMKPVTIAALPNVPDWRAKITLESGFADMLAVAGLPLQATTNG